MRNGPVKDFFEDTDRYLLNNSELKLRKAIIGSYLHKEERGRMLDLGCGDGSISTQFLSPETHVTFVDFSSEMLATLERSIDGHQRKFASFIKNDVVEYDIEGEFDVVLCLGLLAHVPSHELLFEKLINLLAPRGLLLLQFSDTETPVGRLLNFLLNTRIGTNKRGYKLEITKRSSIQEQLTLLGLKLEDESSFAPKIPYFHRKLPKFTGWYQERSLHSRKNSWLTSEKITKFRKA